MKFINSSESQNKLFAVAMILFLGVMAGTLAISIAGLANKWLVYVIFSAIFLLVIVTIRNLERFLWGLFILSFQFDIYLRILYGYADTDGLRFPLTLFTGIFVASYYMLSRRQHVSGNFTPGGYLSIPIFIFLGSHIPSILATTERFVGLSQLFTTLQYYFIYLIALNCTTSEIHLKRTIKLLLLTLCIQSIVYFIQSALGITFTLTGSTIEALDMGKVPRPGGTVSTTPAGFASFILPVLFISLSYFISKSNQFLSRSITGIVAALGLVALVLTFTRAAWGSFIVGFLWLVLISYRRRMLSKSTLILVAGVIVTTVAILAPLIISRLDGAPLEGSYNERFDLMRMAALVIKAHPIVGVGPGAYPFTFKEYLTPELAGKWLFTVHNNYLLNMAELGIIGGLCFIFLLVMAIRLGWRMSTTNSTNIRIFLLGCSAGILAISFENYWEPWIGFTYNAMLWLIFGLLEAAVILAKKHSDKTSAVAGAHKQYI